MTRALVTSSKYSPGNMKPEALEALFVGREKTLHDVLARIAASATGRSKHFFLLVGPRGIGKTQFVAIKNPFPVLIVYWTVSVGASGEIRYMRDVYDLDRPVLAALDARRRST